MFQLWAAEFKEEHGRVPNVWIDRCCLDVFNIAQDLVNLPVYVACAKHFLMIVGPTFPERMWTMMELFVYEMMNGGSIEMRLLPGTDPDVFRTFDVRRCQCAEPADHERMIAVIRAAFTSVDEFNAHVTSMVDHLAKVVPADHGQTAHAQLPGPQIVNVARAGSRGRRWPQPVRACLRNALIATIVAMAITAAALCCWKGVRPLEDCLACAAQVAPRMEDDWLLVGARAFWYSGVGPFAHAVDEAGARAACAARDAALARVSGEELRLVACLVRVRSPAWVDDATNAPENQWAGGGGGGEPRQGTGSAGRARAHGSDPTQDTCVTLNSMGAGVVPCSELLAFICAR